MVLTPVRNADPPRTDECGPVVLLPNAIELMIAARSTFQVMKFRTTCTDCVPNF